MLGNRITLGKLLPIWATAVTVGLLLVSGGCGAPTPTPSPQMNRPPVIIEGIVLPLGTLNAGEEIEVWVGSVNDPDGDSIVYTWRASSGTIEPSRPSLDPVATYTALAVPGEDTITVIISDGKGGTTSDSVRFSVTAPPMPVPMPTRLIEIAEPHDAAIVPQEIRVRGTFGELPLGTDIWTVVYIDGLYWPQRRADQFLIGNVPTWQSTVWIGTAEDKGKQFDVLAVLADKETDDLFAEWLSKGEVTGEYPGLPALPAEATIYDKITVVRR